MIKRLQAVGNSSGVIIDRPILDLLNITAETQLEVSTDGERLIITPVRARSRKTKVAEAQAKTLAKHAETFRKLSK
jgi:antitoxin MazE